jgi:hypothetical protein
MPYALCLLTPKTGQLKSKDLLLGMCDGVLVQHSDGH